MPVRVFPVRHHSPSASRCLVALLEKNPPKAILIEGPSDAESLIPVLVDEATEPPVAILAYVAGGDGRVALYPLVSYSPEYTALREGARLGISTGFFDVPSGVALAQGSVERERAKEAAEKGEQPQPVSPEENVFVQIPAATGFTSFEEFWESSFEMPATTPEEYSRMSLAYGQLIRALDEGALQDPDHRDRVRERFMRERVRALVAEGLREEEILLVTGAAHAAAFVADDFLDGGAGPPPVATELTIIPYSYGRMSEQLGYGAGNRAPLFYEKVYDRRGDFGRTALETMIGIAEQLRLRGHPASLSDVIDAHRLGNILARMRGKVGPGLEEIRDAAVACMLQGRFTVLEEVWRSRIIGASVGKVSARIGKTSLQEEFRREVAARRIPATDEKTDFWLHLTSATEVGTSIFLHRLRAADIPFAQLQSEGPGAAILSRVREKWSTQWTPATEVALVEKIVHGQTIAQVCETKLRKALTEAKSVGVASQILLRVTACDLRDLYEEAPVGYVTVGTDDLYELAVATQNVAALLAYGTTRAIEEDQLRNLLLRLFHRAASAIPRLGRTDDEGTVRPCTALKILYEVSTTHAKGDRMLLEALHWSSKTSALNPGVSGLATSLLYLGKAISEADLENRVRVRVGGGALPMDGAQFLEGLLSINRSTLVKSRAIVAFLDGLVTSTPVEAFRDILPVFRRTFGELSRAEMGYLLEHVFALHGVVDRKAAAGLASVQDLERLREADSQVRQITDQWDDLFRR